MPSLFFSTILAPGQKTLGSGPDKMDAVCYQSSWTNRLLLQVSIVSIPRKMGNGDRMRVSFLIDVLSIIKAYSLIRAQMWLSCMEK